MVRSPHSMVEVTMGQDDWKDISEEALQQAILMVAEGDRTALLLIYRFLLGACSYFAKQTRPSTAANTTLTVDVADEAIINVFKGAATFRPDRGSAKGWLFAVARNAYRGLQKDGGLGGVSREESLFKELGNDRWTVLDLADSAMAEGEEDAGAGHRHGIIRDAKDHGFLSPAECNALWMAASTQRWAEAVAEWVFGDATRTDAGEQRYRTIVTRLDVCQAVADMTNGDVRRQVRRAVEMQFVAKDASEQLLRYLLGDADLRAAEILGTTWGMREDIRLALFGFAASVHLGREDVATAVVSIAQNIAFAAWCVTHDWPEPYGRLLKKLAKPTGQPSRGEFWERLGFRSLCGPGKTSPRLNTASISETRRLAADLRVLAHGLNVAVAANDDFFSDEALERLLACRDVAALQDLLDFHDCDLCDYGTLKEVLDAGHQGEISRLALFAACSHTPALGELLRAQLGEVK